MWMATTLLIIVNLGRRIAGIDGPVMCKGNFYTCAHLESVMMMGICVTV